MPEQPPQVPSPPSARPTSQSPPSRGTTGRRPASGKLPPVVLARDLTPAATQAAVRAGTLERIRTGAYRRPTHVSVPASTSAATPPALSAATAAVPAAAARELALARIAAVDRQLRTAFWFSHESAALVWGCAVWKPPTRTHLIQTFRAHQQGDPLTTRHFLPLTPADRTRWRGVPVTTLDRTVVDCLTRLPPLDALVIADSALRLGVDPGVIADRLGTMAGHRGIAGARVVLDHADARAESPWETFVRYVLVSHGLPRPDLQIPVHTRLGWFWADLGWPEWKLLIEFDGFVKYSGNDPARTVYEEKRRQDAIEEEGLSVLRVTAADLRRPATFLDRVCRRLPEHVVAHRTPVRAFSTW
ncbi:MAG TPA: hypothetical protein VIK12_08795 [Pengzhenrongella sp.]